LSGKPEITVTTREKDEVTGKFKVTTFTAFGKGYCGNCWLCGFPVYFYFDEDERPLYTPCGECDHIGGIVASLLSGMLTTTGKKEDYIYNYGTSHVHCNRSKSDYLSMKFDRNNNMWVVDENGIVLIAKAIINNETHIDEYDPEFKAELEYEMDIDYIIDRIRRHTVKWCEHANYILIEAEDEEKDMATQILKIIKYTYDNVEDKFNGGAPKTEGSEVFKLDQLNGFEIDDNLNDEIVNRMLTELRKDPLFYKLLNNLIKSIEETLIDKYGFTPEMIDEFTYHPTYKRPRNDFYKKQHKQIYFPMDNTMDFPRDNVFGSNQNMISVYGGKRKNKSIKKNKKTRHSKKQNKTRTKTK
jgi:hypothetical protein